MKTNTHRLTAALLGCGLTLSLTACGGGREYSLPEAACGVPLDAEKIDPFLVDGKTFEVAGDPLNEPTAKKYWKCTLSVDDTLVVAFQVDAVDRLHDPMAASEEFRFANRAKMERLPFSGLGALGDRTAVISTECAGTQAAYLFTEVSLSTKTGGDTAERRKAIEAFAVDLVPKVQKALGCTA
ncbi:hypothetical protein [Streptomyces sp. NPDC085529]|uniref:hypothetical protein n=1 Tax=Streptomyces sp. NPDC085529 TaxID=3365729 RepID=UPI0037D414FC